MATRERPSFDPEAIAEDVSNLLSALAGVTELGASIEIRLESAAPLERFATDAAADARELAKETLEDRAESVGAEDAAIEEARRPMERVATPGADHSSVIGSISDIEGGAGISGGHVVARTRDGHVIGEAPIDAGGGFAVELEAASEEIRIEAFDEEGRSVSISTLELEEEAEPAAHVVEMVTTGVGPSAADVTEEPRIAEPIVTPGRAVRLENLARIREISVENIIERRRGRGG